MDVPEETWGDILRLMDSDCPDILHEFAQDAHKAFEARTQGMTGERLEREVGNLRAQIRALFTWWETSGRHPANRK